MRWAVQFTTGSASELSSVEAIGLCLQLPRNQALLLSPDAPDCLDRRPWPRHPNTFSEMNDLLQLIRQRMAASGPRPHGPACRSQSVDDGVNLTRI